MKTRLLAFWKKKKMDEGQGLSLNALVWKRFKQNTMAMCSLVVILLFVLVA
ncbi:MAG: hypothetical protein IKY43_02925, partial [Bacteroidales bacterium]|nr:hypothetical protein [Bacteroidales bacterium]